MDIVLALLAFGLSAATFVGLLSPKIVLRKSENPTRGKVLKYFGLPAFVLFLGFGMLHESGWDKALKNPTEAKEVNLRYKRLSQLPDELQKMTGLVKLDVSKNNLTTLPTYLKDFDKLEEINLSENPISELPAWIGDMKSLKTLILDETKISSLPDGLEDLTISYQNTPLFSSKNPVTDEKEQVAEEETKDEREETLAEFAVRKFLGKDYDERRKFKKGEIYYNSPVTKDQVDAIGESMLLMGIFNDEREASMLLDQNKDGIYELKTVVTGEDDLTEEVMQGFSSLEKTIQEIVFPDDEFHLILTDGDFDAIRTIE